MKHITLNRIQDIYDVVVSTGYRNLKGTRLNYDVVKEYDDKAQVVISWEYKASYEQKRQEINELLNSFLDYCIEA